MSDLINPSIASQFTHLPPHNLEAEQCLISSLMLCGGDKALFARVLGIVDREVFYSADHQLLFDAIMVLYRNGKTIDAVSVRDWLASRQLLEEVGGVAYIGEIINKVPSWAHAADYAEIVREKALWRSMIVISNDALRAAYAPSEQGDAERALTELAAKCSRAAAAGYGDRVHRLGDVVQEVLKRRFEPDSRRISTGLADLDRLTGGLRVGGTTIIAGKAGMGKSVLVKQLARNIAGDGKPFGIISIEENRHKISENILALESGVINCRIAFGTASPLEWEEAEEAGERLAALPIFIVDSASTLSAITAAAHLLACECGCKVIAVDHLHIVDAEAEKNSTREREISKISGALKGVWKSLGVAGIEAAQLNRASGRERPTMDNLRDSGSLGQDGDVIVLLHREDYYRRKDHKPGDGPLVLDGVLELIVDKNKDGSPGRVCVKLDEARQRITDLEATEAEADPVNDLM